VAKLTFFPPVMGHPRAMMIESGQGVETMMIRKMAVYGADCFAVVMGLLIAAPFFLVMAAPFVVGQ
jgi:hypothetical protein